MKVLNIISTMKPEKGGVSQALRDIIPALQVIGLYNEVVCFDSPNSDYINKDPFTINAIGKGNGPYAYNKNLSKWLKSNFYRFDVVIIHGLWLYNSYGTYKAWRKFKKESTNYPKLFVMPHGMLDPYFQRAKERRIKALRNLIFYTLFERKVINNSSGLLFTCEQELILAHEPFRPYKPRAEFNVGFGIQPPPAFNEQMSEAFYKRVPDLPRDRSYLLFLSRIHYKKGVDLLINAYNKLQSDILLPALVIAGPGLEDDYGKQLLSLAKNNNNIFFPGMLSGNQKWGAFYNCEAFVLPSHQENFGIAVVEAMACKKAVLITDKVNIWREIENGGGGIVKNDDLDGAEALLLQWAQNDSKRKSEVGESAYNIYKQFFSVSNAAEKLKAIFEEQLYG